MRPLLLALIFVKMVEGSRQLVCNKGRHFECICGTLEEGKSTSQDLVNRLGEELPSCSTLLGQGGGGKISVLSIMMRPRLKGPMPDVCLTRANWEELELELRLFLAERINRYCDPRPRDCPGVVLNVRSEAVLLIRVECNRVDVAILKGLNYTAISSASTIDPFQLAAILEPWTTLFQLMFHKDAAILTIREFRYPKAVTELKEAMKSERLFHFLYAASAIVFVLIFCFLILIYNIHSPPPRRRPVRVL